MLRQEQYDADREALVDLALSSMAESVDAQLRNAIAEASQGRTIVAISQFREIICTAPDYPPAYHNLGVALAETGEVQEAASNFERAITLRADYVEAHLNLAHALVSMGKLVEAAARYRRCLELSPDLVVALNGFGRTLWELKRYGEAVVYLRQAVRLKPDYAEAHNNLGLALAERQEFHEAERSYERALKLDPRYVAAHTNLATCRGMQGHLAEALAQYDLAMWLKPNALSCRWNRALALLHLGRWEEGFREYEWRWKRPQTPMRAMPKPLWGGSPLQDKTILVWMEQGLGDAIQFVRYTALLKRQGARVIAECAEPLVRVVASCRNIDELIHEGKPLPDYDFHVPAMSLPWLTGTTLENVPAEVSYLGAEVERMKRWGQHLAAVTPPDAFKIGVAWAGNPHHQFDRYRSTRLSELERLARVPGVRLFSLQRGPGAEQVAALRGRFPLTELLDPKIPASEGWADAAAIMKHLDLVVTVDTATAHLAGALGVRTWVALSTISDWRWLEHREDSPWYPTVRLFRQPRLGDWGHVFSAMASELSQLPGAANAPKRDRRHDEASQRRTLMT